MRIGKYNVYLTESDIEAMADSINDRVRELIDNNQPLDFVYTGTRDNVCVENDKFEFVLVFEDGQPKISNACYSYGFTYYLGKNLTSDINLRLEKI
jgi:hypothetical protein